LPSTFAAHHAGHRARMGRLIADRIKTTGLILVAQSKSAGG
jgi:hypothetical protein